MFAKFSGSSPENSTAWSRQVGNDFEVIVFPNRFASDLAFGSAAKGIWQQEIVTRATNFSSRPNIPKSKELNPLLGCNTGVRNTVTNNVFKLQKSV